MLRAHSARAHERKAIWLSDEHIRQAVIRSTWLLHGREIIFAATETDGSERRSQDEKNQMIQTAFKYLRAVARGITQDDLESEHFLKPSYTIGV